MKPAAHCHHFQASDPLRTVTLVSDVIRMEQLGPAKRARRRQHREPDYPFKPIEERY